MRAQIIKAWIFSLGCIASSHGYTTGWKASTWLHEVKLGVLHHDTGGLWSGFRRESGADFNLEAIFSPLTATGRKLHEPVALLCHWAAANTAVLDEIDANRPA